MGPSLGSAAVRDLRQDAINHEGLFSDPLTLPVRVGPEVVSPAAAVIGPEVLDGLAPLLEDRAEDREVIGLYEGLGEESFVGRYQGRLEGEHSKGSGEKPGLLL